MQKVIPGPGRDGALVSTRGAKEADSRAVDEKLTEASRAERK